MIETKIIDLDEVGTRYRHYSELREIFSEGVAILRNAEKLQSSEQSKKRIVSLQCAADEVDNRLGVLSGFEKHMGRWGTIAKEINSIERTNLLTEGSNEVEGVKKVEIEPIHTSEDRPLPFSEESPDEPDCV
jgi:hypothetical protein